MKIVHVTYGLPDTSGVSTFCVEIAVANAASGENVTLLYDHDDRYKVPSSIRLICANSLDKLDFTPDIVHLHSIWSMFSYKVMHWCFIHNIPYIVSPHGGLMPRVFTKGRLKKKLAWFFLLKPYLKKASAIHCTAESEVEACQKLGLKGPFVIAPLGVYLPELNNKSNTLSNSHTVLFLGRLSEEKGLLNLLEAWKHLKQKSIYKNWILNLAGPDWKDYKQILQNKIITENITNVEFTGSANAKMKDKLYRGADIFVLPSPMENFSVVVLEALSYYVPAIATKGTPWRELETEQCGKWIDQGIESLEKALAELMSMSNDERSKLGKNGRALAENKYTWTIISEKLINFYKNIK